MTFSLSSLVIPPWAPYAAAALAPAVVLAGVVLWDVHEQHVGAAKMVPVVQAAQVSAAVSQGVAQVATKQSTNSSNLHAATTAIQSKASNDTQAVQAATTDADAFRAYLSGLHDNDSAQSGDVGAVSGGPQPAN